MRADAAVVQRGIAQSRARAKELIDRGQILVEGKPVKKAAQDIADDATLVCMGETLRYVGRGGLKLEHALSAFPISLAGAVCLDIGASTGGFTDCMLQNGAKRVFAIDVGHGQLAPSLQSDARVVNLEGTDIRGVTPEQLGGQVDFFTIDVSFISLTLVLPAAAALLRDGGSAVVLVKPQFEAGRSALNKQGVVRDVRVHRTVLARIAAAVTENGFSLCGACPSGIRGGSGNAEYLFYLKRAQGAGAVPDFSALAAAACRQ